MMPSQRTRRHSSASVIETLEERKLLAATAPRIHTFYLDNRGQGEFLFDQTMDKASMSRSSIQVFTAGPDSNFGTSDDVRVSRTVSYKRGRLVVNANLPADTRYRIRLAGLVGINALALDGEFPASGTRTGNGVAGGNFDVTSQAPLRSRARFSTEYGFINVAFWRNNVDATIANFMHYANEAAWDGTFVHRSARGSFGIIQAGGFNVVDGAPAEIHQEDPVNLQASFDHLRGTIGMARPGDVNQNTNQWFFNVTENAAFNDQYTSFGIATDRTSLRAMEAINKLTIVNAGGGGISPFGELPVRDPAAGATRQIRVPQDLVIFDRVAMLMDGEATPGTGATQGVSAAASASPAKASAFSTTKLAKDRIFDDARSGVL